MLNFDEYGNLTPDQPIESTLAEIEAVFVFNEKRRVLFAALQAFLVEINDLKLGASRLWVDGSFVTKKLNPGDIDLVIFIDYQIFKQLEKHFYLIRQRYQPRLDLYFVPRYPAGHSDFIFYNLDKIDWQYLFSRDSSKRNKGFDALNL